MIMFTLKWLNYHKIPIWIYYIVVLCIINPTYTGPTNAENVQLPKKKPRSFSIGQCTWVTNRTCPDIDVKFYLYTRDNPNDRQYIQVGRTYEESNLTESNFNPFFPVKVIIHGYNSDMFLNPLIQMKEEYFQRGDYNLFYVDWSVLAPGPCYIMAVHNTRHVGGCIAMLVNNLLDIGVDDIHLIGFSLGAQVTNYVAQNLPHFKLPRITGLDPAMPLFATARKEDKLDASDARFVDVYHTNALVQGKIERCGDVDFYMNGGILQPGCPWTHKNPFACSHQRAPDYFCESINSQKGFWGWYCSSYITYLLGMCPPDNYPVLGGEDCKLDTRHGMYLAQTNSKSPYAQGQWTNLSENDRLRLKLAAGLPGTGRDPFQQMIDQWGKLDGDFNNRINNFPDYNSLQDLTEYDNYEDNNHKKNNYFNKINMPMHSEEYSRDKHSEFIEHYKRNLSQGIRTPEVFRVPVQLNN